MIEKKTEFRHWLYELWMRNCDEHREYNLPVISQEVYFRQYKYWLKREFKFQRSQNA